MVRQSKVDQKLHLANLRVMDIWKKLLGPSGIGTTRLTTRSKLKAYALQKVG